MRVLVTGGRWLGRSSMRAGLTREQRLAARLQDKHDRTAVWVVLERLHRGRVITTLVHGAAPGLDLMAHAWALGRGVPTEPHPADWGRWSRAAGGIRNAEMVGLGADLVVVFPGGAGTADCLEKARAAGLDLLVYDALPAAQAAG